MDSKVLKSYFPELCQLIIQKNIGYQDAKTKERLEIVKKEITQTVLHLSSNGIYPSRRTVENAMPYKGALRKRSIQNVWKALLATIYYN